MGVETRFIAKIARWTRLTLLAPLAASVWATVTASTVLAQGSGTTPPPNQRVGCADRYHARLAREVLPKAELTLEVANQLRTKSKEHMPGRWLFWDGSGIANRTRRQKRLLATQIIDRQSQRMCVRPVLVRGGRIRCLKWQPIPAGYTPPPPKITKTAPIKTKITMAERRIAARLRSRVISKGALYELTHGTALYHLAQRSTDELIGYARQPYRSTICSGAPEMVGFYRARLQSLGKRVIEAARQNDAIHKTAISTIRAAIGASSTHPGEQSTDLASLLHRLLGKVLTRTEMAELPKKSSSIELLEKGRKFLTEQRLEALPIEQHQRTIKALRSTEFAFYADYNHRHLQRLDASFQTVLNAILTIHSQECGCHQL